MEVEMADNMKTYEGMFLVEPGEFQAASEPVRTVLNRSGAEVLAMKPWDERRLAYEMLGRKRALYVLTYFKVDPEKVVEIEHDCQLNEGIIRVLILNKDGLTDEVINAETPITSGRRSEDSERRDRDEQDEDERPRRRRDHDEPSDSEPDKESDSDEDDSDEQN
jgi:small subunit ribosomal protein S6